MGYINIYNKMPAKRAIKALQKAQSQEEQSETVKERLKTLEFYKEFGESGIKTGSYKPSHAV
jgi:hypothetical protein